MTAAVVQIWDRRAGEGMPRPNPAKALADKVPRGRRRVLAFDDNFCGPSRKSETPEALVAAARERQLPTRPGTAAMAMDPTSSDA
jgi:hypothetical protein